MSSAPLGSRGAAGLPGRPETQTSLADILERVLDKGIVIAGDIQINLLDIELLTIKLRLLVASVDKAREMGINWWEGDPSLQARRRRRRRRERRRHQGARAREPGAARAPRPAGARSSARASVPGELDRWAAERAGELIARAEAEAVAELKAALLRAAAGAAQAPAREPAPESRAGRRHAAGARPGAARRRRRVGLLRRARRPRADGRRLRACTRTASSSGCATASSRCCAAGCR